MYPVFPSSSRSTHLFSRSGSVGQSFDALHIRNKTSCHMNCREGAERVATTAARKVSVGCTTLVNGSVSITSLARKVNHRRLMAAKLELNVT